jgi:hypothetical protein
MQPVSKEDNMHFFKTVFSPKTILECFSIAFRFVGAVYVVIGAVSIVSGTVKQDGSADIADLKIGAALLLLALCLWLPARAHCKKMETLQENGFRVRGRIHSVRKYWFINISYGARRSPRRLFYEYDYGGQSYRGHSDLIWKRPDFQTGDPVSVLIDENAPRISCPDLTFARD